MKKTTMRALIPYAPGNVVAAALGVAGVNVDIEPVRAGVGRLISFASDLPLAPGDLLALSGDVVTGIVELQSTYLFEVILNMPTTPVQGNIFGMPSAPLGGDLEWGAAQLAADQVAEELSRLAEIHRGTTLSITLATQSRVWFDAWISQCPHVWGYQVVREPGSVVDWERELTEIVDRPTFDPQGKPL
jgi:hypothetical protein